MEFARKSARIVACIDLTFVLLKIGMISILVFRLVKKEINRYTDFEQRRHVRDDFSICLIFVIGIIVIICIVELWAIRALLRATKKEQKPLTAVKEAKDWVDITIFVGALNLILFGVSYIAFIIVLVFQVIIQGPMLAVVGNFISKMEKIVKREKRQNRTRPSGNSTETV